MDGAGVSRYRLDNTILRAPEFPDDPDGVLLRYFTELTRITHCIDPTYLINWARVKGVELTSWQGVTLLEAFAAYQAQVSKSRNQECPDPLMSEEEKRMAAVKAVKARLRRNAK